MNVLSKSDYGYAEVSFAISYNHGLDEVEKLNNEVEKWP